MRDKCYITRYRDFGIGDIKKIIGSIKLADKVFSMLLSAWENMKQTTVYAEAYAKKEGLSYARPITVIMKGDSLFKRLKTLLGKVGSALKSYSFMLAATILKEIVELLVMLPRIVYAAFGIKKNTDDLIKEMLLKKNGKIYNTAGRLAAFLKSIIVKILNGLLQSAKSKSAFDPNDPSIIEASYKIDSRYGRKRRRDAKIARRFSDDLTVEIQNFFRNIGIISQFFKNGDFEQGYLMLKGLMLMIKVSLINYGQLLAQRIGHVNPIEFIKITSREILDLKRMSEAIKKLLRTAGPKALSLLRSMLSIITNAIKSAISYIRDARTNKSSSTAMVLYAH